MALLTPSLSDQLICLERLAYASLKLWPVPPDAKVRLINVSENATYLVDGKGYQSVLRIHRAGYHSRTAIDQELAWARALSAAGVVLTPFPIPGLNGALVQQASVDDLPEPRFMVMFDFIPGRNPDTNDDLVARFAELGAIAARTHIHSRGWPRSKSLHRLIWDTDAVFGAGATWGDWRDAPNITPEVQEILERTEDVLCRRLSAFGKGKDRYGLIHADMRLANLLIDQETTRLIDFDDCGLGWFLYDFAAGISFMEDHPTVPALRNAWVQGYRSVQPLSDVDEAEIDTFVMLRRMALLAWIGSHIEAPEPQKLAATFAKDTAILARVYLSQFADSIV